MMDFFAFIIETRKHGAALVEVRLEVALMLEPQSATVAFLFASGTKTAEDDDVDCRDAINVP